MSTDDKVPPVPEPFMRDGVGWCHPECPALAHLGNIYQRCLKLDREVRVRDICGVWVAKAGEALRAMEWLRERLRTEVEWLKVRILQLRDEREKIQSQSADRRFHVEQLEAEVERLTAHLTAARNAVKLVIARGQSVPWQTVSEEDVDSFVEFMREKIAQTGKDGGA